MRASSGSGCAEAAPPDLDFPAATLHLSGQFTVQFRGLFDGQGHLRQLEQIERDLLLKEALASLSEDERQICLFKTLGYSTDEIARQQQRTPGAVDTMFCRAKQKLRDMLARPASAPSSQAPSATRTASASSHPPLLPGPSDGPAPSLTGRRRVWG